MPNNRLEGLCIGVPEIDDQHRELLARVRDLVEAVAAGEPLAEIDRRTRSVEAYAVAHFGSEEELMIVFGWPHYAEHRREHSAFLERYVGLRDRLLAEPATPNLAIELRREVHDELIRHFAETDMALGEFLRARLPNRRQAAS